MNVAMFYNIEGWAWWHRINNIKNFINSSIKITEIKIGDSFDHSLYDLVVVFEARYLYAAGTTPPSKLIIGCSCPALLNELKKVVCKIHPVGVIVNNYEMWKISKRWSNSYNCPNGVNTDTFFPSPQLVSRELAIWIGDENALINKGLDLIKRACLAANYPLLCIEKSQLEKTKGLMSHQSLRDKVYHRASVLICASEAEGTPNPGLEALACGVPVISTLVGNMTEIIKDGMNGFLVDRSVKGILEALLKLRLLDNEKTKKIAQKTVNPDWSWKIKSKNYELMFQNIIERI